MTWLRHLTPYILLWLRHLTLHLLLFSWCEMLVPFGQKSWISGAGADDSSEKVIYSVLVNLTSSDHEIDARFLSISFPAKYIPVQWTDKLTNLASALSPADIRVLGKIDLFCPDEKVEPTDVQRQALSYSEHRDSCTNPDRNLEFVLRGSHWQVFNANVAKVGWSLLLGLENVRRRRDGSWDSAVAELLVNFSSTKGIPIRYFHLGNEPNLYYANVGITIPAKTLVADYRALRQLVSKYPMYAGSKFYGPEVTTLDKHATARNYLTEFLAAGAETVVDAISFHHYYCKNNASAAEFLNASNLDSLRRSLEVAQRLAQTRTKPLPIILSETSSCSGGGTPGLSDRYIAGFLWLDKLGLSALYGIQKIYRQSFYSGASYSLVLGKDTTPQPDYYLSVLFKRLIEGPVLKVTVSTPNQKLRVYANCARAGRYPPGALVIYYINLEETEVTLSLSQFPHANLDLYTLTPGDDDGLNSKDVKLNGDTLQMSGSELPALLPERHRGEVTVEGHTFGFIVVPTANVTLCQIFQRERQGGDR